MAGQEIIFNFLSRGSAQLAGDFRKVGDDAALSSAGVKTLQDIITKLGDKEDRTAAQSLVLAKALRQTGDAADVATAKAVVADAAIGRLGEQMKNAEKNSGGLGKALSGLGGLGGAAGAVGLAGIASGALGILPAVAAAGAGVAAFGALALPTLKGITNAMAQVKTDTTAYDRATTAAGKNTALAHIKADWAALSPGQAAAVKGIQALQGGFDKLATALAPLTLRVLNDGLKVANGLLPFLGPLAKTAGNAIDGLVTSFGKFTQGAGFKSFMATMTSLAGPAITGIGVAFGKIAISVGKLLQALASPGGMSVFAGVAAGLATAITGLANGFAFLNKHVSPAVMHDLGTAILAVYGAVKLWAVAQAGLDALLAANPVGIIVVAVAALAAAFTIAWKNSATFRDVIKGIGVVMLQVGIVIVRANQAIISSFLSLVGTILHGLVDAFGWIPGLGPKLKTASKAFDGFKTGVDNVFNGIVATMQLWQAELNKSQSTARAVTATINTAFQAQAKAAGIAKSAVDTYTTAIRQNGVTSQAAKAARDTLVADMIKAGVNGATARAAVAAYTTAIQQNGISSAQAAAARAKLISDILAASNNARQGRTDLDNYNTSVIRNGTSSDAARAARAKLITDLTNAGLSAKDAAKLVNGLGANIKALPGSKAMALIMSGKGTYSLSEINAATGKQKQAAAGWLVTGGTPGKDSVLIRAMPGELVVPTHMVRAGVVDHLRGRIPGFASGGLVQQDSGGVLSGKFPGVMYADFQKHLTDAMVAGMRAAIKAAIAAAQAAAAKVGGVSGAGPTGGDQATNLKLARSMFPWGASEWPAYNTLEMHEAGYNRFARNSSSGAYGIPQAYPPTKMPFAAQAAGGSHAGPQLSWMFSYIRSVYGTPSAAWAQYYNHPGGQGSYDRGGWLMPGTTLAVNNTGRPEQVIPGGGLDGLLAELRALRAEVRQLTGVTAAGPAATGRHVGAAIGGAASSASFRSRYPRGGA